MSDFKRYTEQEIADAYTKLRMAIKGQTVNVNESVRASDYDALLAHVREARRIAQNAAIGGVVSFSDMRAFLAATAQYEENGK